MEYSRLDRDCTWFTEKVPLELFLTPEFAASITFNIILISIFKFVQRDILYGHVFAMKFSLEHFGLAALTQFRQEFWSEFAFRSQQKSSL